MERQVAQSAAILFLLVLALNYSLSAQQATVKAGIVQVTEGEVFLNGNPLQLTDCVRLIQTGQTLSTKQGRAELIIASGAYFSLSENGSLRMEQNELNRMELTLSQGSVLIEVVEKLTSPISVRLSGNTVEISKAGLYRLDSGSCEFRVYGGIALVENGSKKAPIKRDIKVRLDGNLTQSTFNPKAFDALHRWSARKSFDIFLANPETDNWNWTGLTPQCKVISPEFECVPTSNQYPVGFFFNPNYRMRFRAQLPVKYAQKLRKMQEGTAKDQAAVQRVIDNIRIEQEEKAYEELNSIPDKLTK